MGAQIQCSIDECHTNGRFVCTLFRPHALVSSPPSVHINQELQQHKFSKCSKMPTSQNPNVLFPSPADPVLFPCKWVLIYVFNLKGLIKSTKESDVQMKVVSLAHLPMRKHCKLFCDVNSHLAPSTIANHSRRNQGNEFQACLRIYFLCEFKLKLSLSIDI